MPQRSGRKRELVGTVIGDKMDKTVVVKTETLKAHSLYGRTMRKATKFKVHDESNSAKVGDKVRIVETRPLSKEKRWRLVEILK